MSSSVFCRSCSARVPKSRAYSSNCAFARSGCSAAETGGKIASVLMGLHSPREQLLHDLQELQRAERLHEISEGAGAERAAGVLLARYPGQQDDGDARRAGVGAQALGDFGTRVS